MNGPALAMGQEMAAAFTETFGKQYPSVVVNFGDDYPGVAREAEMLRADAGRNLTFTRVVARRR